MDVRLSAEQEMFAQISAKLAADIAGDWDQGRDPESAQDCTPSPATWARVVDAGWLALRLGEEAGGSDGTCVDVCVLAEQLGRHVVPAPVIGTIMLLEQLRLGGAEPELLAGIAGGDRRLAPLLTADLRGFATSAHDAVAVDAAGAEAGLLVGADLVEIALESAHTGADLTRALAQVRDRDASTQPAVPQIRARALAFGLSVLSADLLGVMGGALDAAVAHAKIREQFGVPIGTFQAVQHLAAECLVSVEASRSAVWYAAWATDALEPAEALEAARIAKAFTSAAGIEVVEAAIQIFGGIGMTWESPAHVWQRRAHLDRRLLGDEHTQYRLLAGA